MEKGSAEERETGVKHVTENSRNTARLEEYKAEQGSWGEEDRATKTNCV